MNEASWEPLPTPAETIEQNWLFQLRRQRYRSRREGQEHDFYVIELADAVHVIARTPDHRLVLVRQFRAGSGSDGYETPGGLVDPGEDPLQAGVRELLEETGYAGDPPHFVSQCWANPSLLTSKITTIFVDNVRPVAPPHRDPGELLEVELVPAAAIPRWIRNGRIAHALCIQGLLSWLVSELPNAPWPAPPNRPRRIRLRQLLLLVLYVGLLLAGTRLDRRMAGALLGATLAYGSWWVVSRVDPISDAVLLRGARLSLRHLTLRSLAALALAMIFAFAVISVWPAIRR
ncbi:MAG: hypothetical protein KatS3mg108_3371 [Isosphaeraceae bacterium]|jgi:8-oxo-dGTP pyrophosphatase MutT (NUDIX family)|nr:MAG: hypothetical protein KatS3mg108_3371 [Isosphaeraceae bacterium]